MTSGYTPKRKTGVGIKPIEIKFPDPVDFNKLRNASTIGKTTNNAKKFVDIRTRINKLGGYGLAGGGLAEATAKLLKHHHLFSFYALGREVVKTYLIYHCRISPLWFHHQS